MYFATLVCCWWRSIFLMVALGNWLNSQILQCTRPISHNAPFRTEMCTFLFWMVYCGVCELVYCTIGFDWQCPIIDSSSDLVQARRLAITCTKDWRIYPSPSFNVFTFQTMTPKLIEWVISNLGRVVLHSIQHSINLLVSVIYRTRTWLLIWVQMPQHLTVLDHQQRQCWLKS